MIVRVTAQRMETGRLRGPGRVRREMITINNVLPQNEALRTPQFYLLWLVLCLNVTAGIGVLGQASLMIQEMFGVTAIAAAGFVGLISIFNMGGRIFWASLSDFIGRKMTYAFFFVAGAVLYSLCRRSDMRHALALRSSVLVIISMYGGGFATDSGVPSRSLRDGERRRNSRRVADGMVASPASPVRCW